MTEYTIIIEDAGSNFAAYAPDVPGCVAAGETAEETLQLMEEALALHIEMLRDMGEPIPESHVRAAVVKIASWAIEAMKRSDVVFVREDGPRCTELETEGYEVVGYSWGANLRLDDSSDLAMFDERVWRVRNEGFIIRELNTADLAKVVEVEFANVNDYPQSAATHHEMPTLEHLVGMIHAGVRFWGVFLEGRLAAVTSLERKGKRWNTKFTSVLAEYRGRGLGAAVKAASISTLFNEGARWFSTGGAASNEASLGANRTLATSSSQRGEPTQ